MEAIATYQRFISEHDINHLSPNEQTQFQAITTDVKTTLGQMHKISDRKASLIRSLPDQVQEKIVTVVDPIDQGIRFVSTWVIGYSSPAPNSVVAGNLGNYYDEYIKDQEGPRSAVYNPLLVQLSSEPK
jgi:hypothetical protein